jgi:hypothetical protein
VNEAIAEMKKGDGQKNTDDKTPTTFSQADLEAKVKAEREKLEKEFNEKLEKEKADAKIQADRDNMKKRLSEFCEQGKIPPAFLRGGLPEMLEHLATMPSMEFSDGQGGVKTKNAADVMLEMLTNIPGVQETRSKLFTEITGHNTADPNMADNEKAMKEGKERAERHNNKLFQDFVGTKK